MSLQRGDRFQLHIESIGFEGVSIARHEGFVFFVDGAVPGDFVTAEVRTKKKSFAEAKLIEIITPSAHRVPATCEHFGDCGGCSWQQLTYSEQCVWKRQHVLDSFIRLGGFTEPPLGEIVPCDSQLGYRNKMEFSFGASRWLTTSEIESGKEFDTSFAFGLHVPGRYDKILDVNQCHLHTEASQALFSLVKNEAKARGIRAYNEKSKSRFLRNLIIRTNKKGELLSVLVTKSAEDENEADFIRWFGGLAEQVSGVTSLLHAVNDSLGPKTVDELTLLYGNGYLVEELLGISFRISPFSFFQTNTRQAEKLVQLAIQSLEERHLASVWDLYCGAGSITLPLARLAAEVVGIELVQSSIDDAKFNAALNGITNVDFFCMDLHKPATITRLNELNRPTAIVIDPPRAGLHKTLVDHLLEIQCQRIVYVSCNPATQARDCALLSTKYRIASLTPVDMFPQTFHIECIAVLDLIETIEQQNSPNE